MFCYKCGNQIPDDSQFCSKCGIALTANLSNIRTNENEDYDKEVMKIYFRDLLNLEFIKNKLQNDLAELKTNIEYKESNNYYQCYYIYTDKININHYLHLIYDGREIKFAAFNNSDQRFSTSHIIKNGYCIDTRQNLNYDSNYGYAVTEWLSIESSKEIFETIWQYLDSGLFFGSTTKVDKNIKDYCLKVYFDFKNSAPNIYKQNLIEINQLKNDLVGITAEFEKVNELIGQAYNVNIIPQQFRNLYAVYYLSNFISTSNESLSTALLHCDLNTIKQKLDEIIEQQQEIIINQALIIAQNEKTQEQNRQQLQYLSSIEQNTDRAAQYAEIASINAKACAWIGVANYIKN